MGGEAAPRSRTPKRSATHPQKSETRLKKWGPTTQPTHAIVNIGLINKICLFYNRAEVFNEKISINIYISDQ